MPVVELHLIEGYDDTVKTRISTALTDAVRSVLPAPPNAVTVMIHDMAPANYMRGRQNRTPAPALPDPKLLVRQYLDAMEARDLDTARTMLGDGFNMTFPATSPMNTLEELIEWSKPRYLFVKKTYDAYEAFKGERDTAVVYCRGTLFGEWPDGTPFDGIRFIDRFEVSGDKITRQDVWNDMAEAKANA